MKTVLDQDETFVIVQLRADNLDERQQLGVLANALEGTTHGKLSNYSFRLRREWIKWPNPDPPTRLLAMPRWRCHKVVEAFKIGLIDNVDETKVVIMPEDMNATGVEVSAEWFNKHKPQVGGYLVQYEPDGYRSYSPPEAFEAGYTRI